MASVVVHAQMSFKPWVARPKRSQPLEKTNRFFARFQITERFGLKSEMQHFTGPLIERVNVINAAPKIPRHCFHLRVRFDEFFEGAGNGADASFDSLRQKFR